MAGTVESLIRKLSKFDPESPLILIEHPYRGSSVQLNVAEIGECGVVESHDELPDDDEDVEQHEAVVLVLEPDDRPDWTTADDESWPGR